MTEHKHLIIEASRFEIMMEENENRPIIKHTVLKAIEAIREINGTLNIDHRRHNMIFKEILEKWAKVLTPAYSFQETQDCLLDICNNIIEDYTVNSQSLSLMQSASPRSSLDSCKTD